MIKFLIVIERPSRVPVSLCWLCRESGHIPMCFASHQQAVDFHVRHCNAWLTNFINIEPQTEQFWVRILGFWLSGPLEDYWETQWLGAHGLVRKCWETWFCLVWYRGGLQQSANVHMGIMKGTESNPSWSLYMLYTHCGLRGSSSTLRKTFLLVGGAALKHVNQTSGGSSLQALLIWSRFGDSLILSGRRDKMPLTALQINTRRVLCFHLHLWTWLVKATPQVHTSNHEQNVGTPVVWSK